MTQRRGERPGARARLGLLVAGMVMVAGLAACGDDGGGAVTVTSSGGEATSTTAGGAGEVTSTLGQGGGETLPPAGSSSCSDPVGDTGEEISEVEGWPDAFDLTGVDLALEEGELVVTAHFAGDVTRDSRVRVFLGDLSGASWDGQSIHLGWDYFTVGGWAATIDTLPFSEEVVLPVVTAEGNLLIGRIPLAELPRLSVPFDWFAFVGNADYCPDGNLQGTASNPATFSG